MNPHKPLVPVPITAVDADGPSQPPPSGAQPASVRGEPPESVSYTGAAENLQTVWVAVRSSLRSVLDDLTLEEVVEGRLPQRVKRLTEQPDAWSRR